MNKILIYCENTDGSVDFCIKGQITRDVQLRATFGKWLISVLCGCNPAALENVPNWKSVWEISGNTCEETPVPVPLGQVEVSKAKLITTAMNAIILKFISWVTAADERAIGVDTGLYTGILSCTLIHICKKKKHITNHSHKRTLYSLSRRMHQQQNPLPPGDQTHRYQGSPSRTCQMESSDPKELTEEARTPSIHPLWGCKLGRVETACIHFIYVCRHVHVYTSKEVYSPRLANGNF